MADYVRASVITDYRPALRNGAPRFYVDVLRIAYHVIPRFTGHLLHNRRFAEAQWFISNAGLAIMVVGFIVRANGAATGTLILSTGGILAAIGAYTFVYNIWRTIDGPLELRLQEKRAREAAEKAKLPLATGR